MRCVVPAETRLPEVLRGSLDVAVGAMVCDTALLDSVLSQVFSKHIHSVIHKY